jgi:hypothetical protein
MPLPKLTRLELQIMEQKALRDLAKKDKLQ